MHSTVIKIFQYLIVPFGIFSIMFGLMGFLLSISEFFEPLPVPIPLVETLNKTFIFGAVLFLGIWLVLRAQLIKEFLAKKFAQIN